MAINCAAIPETLLESELFGYEKGAFTGAVKQTKGKVEAANGGTFFLDEVGDLPMPLQAKLLRFLQERVIERVGGHEEIPVDVRIVCATHQNLKELVKAGRFREDLYYRLSEIVLTIPPLRERDGDAVLLAQHFKNRFCAQEGRGNLHFSPDALAQIAHHDWPGNVREMENCIKRAIIMADGPAITACPAHRWKKSRSTCARCATKRNTAPSCARWHASKAISSRLPSYWACRARPCTICWTVTPSRRRPDRPRPAGGAP
jgi:two-component system NtrC family response regulator